MDGIILNVCEVFAENEQKAAEARKSWNTRSITLDLMYDNIPGLMNAELETKNFIYDELLKKVSSIY